MHYIQAANGGKEVICVVSDDTDGFVLLVYWIYIAAFTVQGPLQME